MKAYLKTMIALLFLRHSGATLLSFIRQSQAPSWEVGGQGVSPETALAVGLKVDMDVLPADSNRL